MIISHSYYLLDFNSTSGSLSTWHWSCN